MLSLQIKNEDVKLKKIRLQSGRWSAVLLPEYGMNTVSLKYGDEEIFRECCSDSAFAKEPLLHGIPVLLPANRTHGACFTFEGIEYSLPMNEPERGNNLHGSFYNTEFEVVELGESRVVSRIINRGEHYPFDFTLTFTDTVTDEGYLREVVLANDGEITMPYTFALHSTFAEPHSFIVPVSQRYDWDENYIPTGEMCGLDSFEKTMLTGCTVEGHLISAPYVSSGNSAVIGDYLLTVSDNFDEWVFYNGNGTEGYLCIEPQCGEVNGLNTDGHSTLKSKESMKFTFEIKKYN